MATDTRHTKTQMSLHPGFGTAMTTRRIFPFFAVSCLLLVGLFLAGALFPSHLSWGFHLFAFLPPWTGWAAILLCTLPLLEPVRITLVSQIDTFARRVSRIPSWLLFIILAVLLTLSSMLLAAKLHLLGDSMLILQLTPPDPSIRDTSSNFRNQPLTYACLNVVQQILGTGSSIEQAYHVLGISSGILLIALIFWFLSRCSIESVDKLLLGAFLFLGVRSQFFFGYVENYSLVGLAVAGYLVSGWLALKKRITLLIPLICLALMVGFHLSAAAFVPAGLVLLYLGWKKHLRGAVMLSALAGVLLLGGGIAVFGTSPLIQRIIDAARYDLLPIVSTPGSLPYGILSLLHLIDWGNALVHIVPGTVVSLAGISLLRWNKIPKSDPALIFLAAAAISGVACTLILNPALGMARDWDVLSVFFIPLQILAAYLFILLLEAKEGRTALLVVVVLSFVQTVGWIGLNASEERHLQRAEMLTDLRLSGTFPKIHFENLALTRFKRGEYRQSIQWYERYLDIDSANPRIIANLSDLYRRVGDNEHVFRMLTRSVSARSRNPGVYSNLGTEYAKQGDTVRALQMFQQALLVDSNYAVAHANLALIYLAQNNLPGVATHASKAIDLGMKEPVLLKYAGYAYHSLRQFGTALEYYDAYLRSVPSDRAVRLVRDNLARIVSSPGPKRITMTPTR